MTVPPDFGAPKSRRPARCGVAIDVPVNERYGCATAFSGARHSGGARGGAGSPGSAAGTDEQISVPGAETSTWGPRVEPPPAKLHAFSISVRAEAVVVVAVKF